MSLQNVYFKSTYRTSENNLLSEFYLPCLSSSIMYDRAVGYFNSSILYYLGNGLYSFIKNNGKMRLICGVELSPKDIEKINSGYNQKDIIGESIKRQVDIFLEKIDLANVQNLCWLIKNDKLDIKIALRRFDCSESQCNLRNVNTIYHEKFGIFTDNKNNRVVFAGSLNESLNGWIYNFESFDVFWSWQSEYIERIEDRVIYFENLWNNTTSGISVYDFPTAMKDKLLNAAPFKPLDQLYQTKFSFEEEKGYKIIPRDYQVKAVENWKDNDYKGLFEMATGTGKTITAILCAEEFIKDKSPAFIIIVCPYQHLVDQWKGELKKFNYRALCCYQNKNIWENLFYKDIVDLNIGLSNYKFVITTSSTASMKSFQQALLRVRDNVSILLIGDEAHNLGASCRKSILKKSFVGRIGLSATPSRWHDEFGTDLLYNYFDKVVFTYDLKEAIDKGNLTPYEYYPILIELNNEEFGCYEKLSIKIAKMIASGVSEDDEVLTTLLMKRANIVNNAENKIEEFLKLVKEDQDLSFTLVYTSPGQIDQIQSILAGEGIFYQRFTAKENNKERKQILKLFEDGDVEILVAMRCLDEGVDIPATKKAFILASSTNPKEFIQRRGRVLRKYPGKEKAIIYDFIAIPPLGKYVSGFTRSVVKRELVRFKEFADLALNKYQARSVVFDLANYYNLLDEV